jgi:HK97 family phage major capsid protein
MSERIKRLRQAEADNKAAQAKLKAEIGTLLDVEKRSDEQVALLKAKKTELSGLEAVAAQNADDLATALKLEQADLATATVTKIIPGKDRSADRPWGPNLHADATKEMREEARLAALGEFGIAVYNASTGRGADPRLFAAATGMGTSVPADGGFAVPDEVAPGIEREMYEVGALLGRVDARTVSGDGIAYNVIDETSRADGSRQGGVRHYWVDQGTAPTASQTKLARVEMKLRKVGTLGYMTDELVADAAGLGGELQAMFTEELVFGVEDAITEGNGAGQPLGYLSAPCLVSVTKETGQAASTINTSNLSKMWARMRPRDKANAVWLVNTDCGPQLDFLSIPAGAGALEPRFVTYDQAGILRIKGRPVVETEYNATLGTVGDIVLINLARYRLIRKGGVEQASSIHVRFTQGEQTFRAFYRCDGQMMPRAALTPFKGTGNTLSPVVVLATRA